MRDPSLSQPSHAAPHPVPNDARQPTPPEAIPIPFAMRLGLARKALAAQCLSLPDPFPKVVLFFSVSDGKRRARVVHACGSSLESAWQKGLAKLQTVMREHRITGKWLRIDQPDRAEVMSWQELRRNLARIKRNYFRLGLSLDTNFTCPFLEQELNANAMLYGGNAVSHAVLNERNFSIYATQRYGRTYKPDFSDEGKVVAFSTRGVFCEDNGQIFDINSRQGFRRTGRLEADDVLPLVASASRFLAQQVKHDGTFIYGYHPCFDRQIETYNALRHASTTYAMIEAWEMTGDDELKASIERSLHHLMDELIRTVKLPDGSQAAFLVDAGDEIKLGGNAVAILALTKYCKVTGTDSFLILAERLALGIRHMQDQTSGAFTHVLNYPDLSVKETFRIIYYEGEAAFGLMRLYELTRDPRWLEAVEKAFEHFIAAEHWRHHDHWLSYCVNELTRYRPLERYFRFGILNFSNHLDFVLTRITTFPTLLELMMAARQMLARINELPKLHHLLVEVDLPKFREALEFRARYLLNGYFWPEIAMYFRNPARIVGSFFIRHHAFRVRIDDVEHYLSGFVAYRKHLEDRHDFDLLTSPTATGMNGNSDTSPRKQAHAGSIWSAREGEEATRGTWLASPRGDWSATGLCIHAPTIQPGNIVAIRSGENDRGVLPQAVRRLPYAPAAMIVSDPKLMPLKQVPVLLVPDVGEAVLAMGQYARSRMTGKILAVTGSTGKTTTVAMLAHVLEPWGDVAKSAFNANLSHGVSWNLASIGPDTSHVVLELAVGRMGRTARIARPHVAIFTNIQSAHLSETSTIRDIAATKAAIFSGMKAGSVAILNRDMLEWQTVYDAAKAAGLGVVHYGTTPDCEFRLVDYSADKQTVIASIRGRTIRYRIGAAGSHMAMNSLAVVAAISVLGHDIEPALARLENFSALSGRGETLDIMLDGRRLTVIDDAYNANPGSMKAALDNLARQGGNRRIAILGQMAELGPGGEAYHTDLVEKIGRQPIDKVYVTGELYAEFWKKLPAVRRGHYASSLDELKAAMRRDLAEGDVVLFKGSHSTNLHHLVDWIKKAGGVTGLLDPAGAATLRHHRCGTRGTQATLQLFPGASALLYDASANAVVYAANEAALHPPASITKLLTLCLIDERLHETGLARETAIKVSARAAEVNSRWGFEAGDRVSIDTLMHATAIVSSNEAAHALAEWHSDSIELFTRALNRRAAELGLTSTLFSSPSGLGKPQRTNARDMVALACHVLDNHPAVSALCTKRSLLWKGKKYPSTNRLLDIPGAEGLKTGTLQGHGNHIVFSALRNGRRWIAVIAGAPSKNERDAAVRHLMQAYAA